MLIEINDESINDLQRESIQKLVKHAKGAHYINVYIRKNGQDYHFEADWLWHSKVVSPSALGDPNGKD